MFKSIAATGVYGRRDLSFQVPDGARVAFIHGPNGIGKSTLLRLVQKALSGDPLALQDVVFSELTLRLTDGEALRVVRGEDEIVYTQGREEWRYPLLSESSRARLSEIDDELRFLSNPPWPRAVNDSLPSRARQLRMSMLDPLRDAVADQDPLPSMPVVLIGTDRLRHAPTAMTPAESRRAMRDGDGGPAANPLEVQRRHLAAVITAAQGAYAEKAQALDSSFPRRLISDLRREPPSLAALDARFHKVRTKQDELTQAGLLDRRLETDLVDALTFSDEDSAVLNVLSTYLADVDAKLDEFSAAATQLSLFRDLADERLAGKHVEVGGAFGFRVVDDTDGDQVPPEALSSGEQHQLFLLNSLIFPPQPGTLFLIDEPEISLHVEWQRTLIEDLERIAALGARQFILATHSPVVIGDRMDLLVDVVEP